MTTYPPAEAYRDKLLPLQKQVDVRNRWLKQRLDEVLPTLMKRESIEMWIVATREYNEDPALMTLIPEPAMSARRRAILVFTLQGENVECLALDRYGYDGFYESAWDPDVEDQNDCLSRVVKERDPKTIGLNFSPEFAFGDGLTHHEHQLISEALGDLMERVQSAERLCLGWLETRIQGELDAYPSLVELGHAIIAEAFSNRVIHPGITTTQDVVWWMREKMQSLGLRAWFHPTVELQAPDLSFDAPPGGEKIPRRDVILPGDLLHCDVGFMYLGLATDQQQQAYVLKPGESNAPEGLSAALAEGNRPQDIHMDQMKLGRTGNEVLKATLDQAKSEGISATVYSHPIGYHGHAAGPTIGLWDQQGGVPGKGDYELFDNTCYSIELNITKSVSEWENQTVRIALEEDAVLSNGKMRWLDGRQSEFHLIGH
jgi:hypothetical protein